ncbi:MAG: PhnD/SsuA/transferrin family substrate-binding protein [Nitriliruptorales bacterium]|nr:PhnD/SsuA/transferrin family substrate-binding protein [Nitriliruptorales bacterium]
MSRLTNLRGVALFALVVPLAAACASGEQGEAPVPAGAPPGAEEDQAEEDQAAPEGGGTGVEGGPSFDLSGTSITATTSIPGALNIGTFWAFERLEEWGAEVDTVILTTTTGIQTLIAGRSDLASHGSDEVVLGAAEGAEVIAIGAPATRMDYVLVGSSDYAEVADLQGGTIAMSGPAGFDALLSRLSLRDAGLDPETDVNFVQVGGSPDRATALLSGQVDAATVFLEDWEELRLQTDDLQLIQYMADIVEEFPASAYFAQASFWEENPDVALALACANLQANAWINEDKQRFIDYTLELVEGATPEAVDSIYDAAQEIDMFPTEPEELFSVSGLGGLVDAMVETGDISSPVEPEEIADISYLQEAADMGCGQE